MKTRSGASVAARVFPVALAVCALWLSLGTVAPLDPATGGRVAVLASWTWLAALSVAGLVVLLGVRLDPSRLRPLYLSAVALLPWMPVPAPGAFFLFQG